MKRRHVVVLASAPLVIALALMPTSVLPLGLTNLWRHRLLGVLVAALPILIALLLKGRASKSVFIEKAVPPFSLLVPILVLLGLLLFPYDIEFDPGDWRDGSITTRGRMVDDLMENHLRIGMAEAEVNELLGPDGCGVVAEGLMGPYVFSVYIEDGKLVDFEVEDHR